MNYEKSGITLDELDWRILGQLQEDASLSNQALSERVFASAATTLRRVRALREAGVIERVVAVLSPERTGGALNAICEITLAEQNAEAFEAFERLAIAEPSIAQCYRTAPTVDFTAANNVRNVRTRFATKRAKFSTAVPLSSRSR
jgi:Lrp/AsnC family transcriptional regulator, leucine-responsive regulatory protein